MPQDTRRDFDKWAVELVYKNQDGCCANCGNPLANGFIRDHVDGNHSNNTIGNLRLLCPRCDETEYHKTLFKQLEDSKRSVDTLIKRAAEDNISGAVLDKALDAIKLSLSLNNQIYGYDIEKPPAAIQAEQYIASSRILLEQWEEAYKLGIQKGAGLSQKAE